MGDDRKFYFGSGSAFQRRLESRDKEKEFDDKDRRKEEEEIGLLRRKLASEGHPDPDDAISKVIKEAEEVWKSFVKPEVRRKKSAGSDSSSGSESSDSEEEKVSSSKQSSDEDDQPIMEQIKSRVESADNAQQRHHTSDEDDNNGMDMDMTNESSPPPTRAPIRLPEVKRRTIRDTSESINSNQKRSRIKIQKSFKIKQPGIYPKQRFRKKIKKSCFCISRRRG